MTALILKRLVYSAAVLVAVSLFIFFATHILPGSAANLLLGEQATPEDLHRLEVSLGLDRPFAVQYLAWIKGVATGDWGESFIMKQPVVAILRVRLQNSALLALFSLLAVIVVGLPLGALAALRHGSWLDVVLLTGSFVGICVPEFVTGIVLILIFAGPRLALFPTGGYADLSSGVSAWLSHLVLPTVTLTLILLAHVVRQTRTGIAAALASDYVRTARLKGASTWRVVTRHALRNGLVPAVTVIALDVGYLMGSIVIVEEVFAFPGLGRLIVFAVQNRDLPVIEMAILIVAATYTFANFAADLLYTFLDPRIRLP
jgi:peptide/nickel transport system permease protein